MKPDFQLFIQNPCSANWNKMSADVQGRFCGLCNHTVVDFTKMSDTEIKEYFRCHSSKKTCGRFRTGQLSGQKRKIVSPAKILLACFTLLAFISGCRKSPVHRPHKMGKVSMKPTEQVEKLK